MDKKTIIEELPYVDGVVECGDQRQIKWMRAEELLNGAKEPNSNKGTINRVPLMLYKNIIFVASKLDESNDVISGQGIRIDKLEKDFEYFGGEDFAQTIEDIVVGQELLEEDSEVIHQELSRIDDVIKENIVIIGESEDFKEMEGSIRFNISHIASILGNKKGEDYYGNIVEDNESSGLFDTMTTVISTVNSLRSQVKDFDNTLNNVELQVSGQTLVIDGLKLIVGEKAKVIIDDKEYELAHDDAIEQLFGKIKDLDFTVQSSSEKVNDHDTKITKLENDLETLGLENSTNKESFDKYVSENDAKVTGIDNRVTALESNVGRIDSLETDISALRNNVNQNNTKIETNESEIGDIKINISQLDDATGNIARSVSEIETSIESLTDKNKDLVREISTLKETSTSQKSEIDGLVSKNTEIESDITTMKDTVTSQGLEITSLVTKNTEIESDITTLKATSTTQESEIASLATKNSELETEIASLRSEKDSLVTKTTELESEITTMKATNATQKTVVDGLVTKNSDLETEIATLKTKNGDQDSKIADILSRLEALESVDVGE